jgi:hypothetical protein
MTRLRRADSQQAPELPQRKNPPAVAAEPALTINDQFAPRGDFLDPPRDRTTFDQAVVDPAVVLARPDVPAFAGSKKTISASEPTAMVPFFLKTTRRALLAWSMSARQSD